MENLDTRELKRRLEHGEPVTLLDVREPFERQLCTIPAGPAAIDLHVPLAGVPGQLGAIREAASLAPLVVYCHHGVRSAWAGRWLEDHGLVRVANLAGGIDAWALLVDPDTPRY